VDINDRITVTVEAEDDATGRVLEGGFEVGAPEELEVALEEAAEELLEAGLDASHGVWLTVTAEDAVSGRRFERQRDRHCVHEPGALRTEMCLMGRDLAIAVRESEQTTRARVEVEGVGEAQAEASGSRELLLTLRAKALRMWGEASAAPALATARVAVETEGDGVYEADFTAADRDEFWKGLAGYVRRLSMEADSARLQRAREEERARLDAERAAARARLLAEGRAHPEWDATVPRAAGPQRRFTKTELDALSVHDDIVLKLTDDLAADIPEDESGPQSDLPHWPGAGPDEGAAIAVWQMLSSEDIWGGSTPSWLHKRGINSFRGWIRPGEVDFVMDWVILIDDGTYVTARDGDAGPYSPPPGCDLQTFVGAVARLSRELLYERLSEGMQKARDMGMLGTDDPRPR
jgi:hypothetical protein